MFKGKKPPFFQFSRTSASYFVLAAGLFLTVISSHFAYENAELESGYRFRDLSEMVRDRIDSRIRNFVYTLQQASHALEARDVINPSALRTASDELIESFDDRGLKSFVYASAKGEEAKVEYLRKANSPLSGGSPEGLGHSLSELDSLKESILLARDTGRAAIAPQIQSAYGPFDKNSILMISALYREGPIDTIEERRAAVRGYVIAAFDADLTAKRILSSKWLAQKKVGFSLALASNEILSATSDPQADLIFESTHESKKWLNAHQHSASIPLTFGPRSFVLKTFALNNFNGWYQSSFPLIILLLGGTLTVFSYRLLELNRQQAEELSKSERQLRLVMDTSPALIGYIDTEFRFQFNSLTYQTWLGHTPEELRGTYVESIFGSERFNRSRPFIVAALRGETVSFDEPLNKIDGKCIALQVTLAPDFGPNGKVKGCVVMAFDVTEERRRSARDQHLVRLSSQLANSLEVETTIDRFSATLTPGLADWCVIDLVDDEGVKRVAARSEDENKQRLLDELGVGVNVADDMDHIASAVIRTGEPVLAFDVMAKTLLTGEHFNERNIKIIEELGHASALFVPLKTRNRVLGCLTLVMSTLDRKLDVTDMEFAMDVAHRAALALENAHLFREVNRANLAKDEFLATLSHELRTPMNVILGWLELMKSETLDQETQIQAVDTLSRNAQLQMQLINDLLDISRIISGKITLQLARTDLASVVRAATESFLPASRAKNIDFQVHLLREGSSVISGDASRITQVIWNLLSNALKFTPEGGKISVVMEATEDAYEVRVIDSGRGIDPRFLPFIFDRFRQEEHGTTRTQGGLGLGLSIVQYLMALHGARIEAHSDGRGLGSTFTLRFPQLLESTIGGKREPALTEVTSAKNISLEGLHVLLLDDSADVRILIDRILVRNGARVSLAENSIEAERIIFKDRPHIFLSDIGLPGEDGFSFMRRLREREKREHRTRIPSAALTGFAQPDDAMKAKDAGFDRHIAKPVDSQTLLEVVLDLANENRYLPKLSTVTGL